MGLRADLNLDVGGAGGSFLAQISAPQAALGAIGMPAIPPAIGDRLDQSGTIDFNMVQTAIEALLPQIPLPGQIDLGDVLGRLGTIVDTVKTLTQGDPRAGIEAAIADLTAELRSAPDGQIGLVLRLLDVVRGRPEFSLLADLLGPLVRGIGVDRIDFPFADMIDGVQALVRALAGMMALETTLAEAERLATAALPLIDAPFVRREIAALQAALPGSGAEAVALLDSVRPDDPASAQAAVLLVANLAARLESAREATAAGFGMVEATVVYLDPARLQAEVDLARGWLRTADLDSTRRAVAALVAVVQPLIPASLDRLPPASLAGLLDLAEAEVTAIAAGIAAIDLGILLNPLQQGIDVLARPLREIDALLEEVLAGIRRAVATITDAVRALPFDEIAAEIARVTEPLADVIGAVTDLVSDVQEALETAATATTDVLGEIEAALDGLKAAVDALFGTARDVIEEANLDAVLGEVADRIRTFADLLATAQLKPVFDTAVEAIDTAADVVSAVPFGLLPESLKSEVDAVVQPIKQVDVDAAAAEIESALTLTADGRFAFRGDIEAALADLTQQFRDLLDDVLANAPREALAEVETKLADLAAAVRAIEPELTLAPVQEAIDQVQATIAGIDIEGVLQPLYAKVDELFGGLDSLSGAALLGPVADEVAAVRSAVIAQTRIELWSEALEGLRAEAQRLLGLIDPSRLEPVLASALSELQASLDAGPSLNAGAGIGNIVASLAQAEGLRLDPASFASVLPWLRGEFGAAAVSARNATFADALARLLAQVEDLDVAAAMAPLAAPMQAVRLAAGRAASRLDASDPNRRALEAAAPRLDAGAIAAALAVGRGGLRALLATTAGLAEGFKANGFSEIDTAAAKVNDAMVPARPLAATVRRILAAIGLAPERLSVGEVVRTLLASAPPERLVGIVSPLLDALRGRVDALLVGVIAPATAAIEELRGLIDAIDLAPLSDAADAVIESVRAELAPLHPRALLDAPVTALTDLRDSLAGADPLAPVLTILDAVRDSVARLLEKLDFDSLLETPLAIYDEIVALLRRIDPGTLLGPLLDLLDSLAHDVDTGLDETVVAFKRLQEALPSGGGGSSASASVSVGS